MQQNCKESLLLQHFLTEVSLTAKKELQKLNRRELVDIIYAFQQNEKKLNGKVASLERALEKTKSEPAPAQMEADPGDPEKEPALMYGDPEENLVSEVQSAKGPVEQPAKEPKDIVLLMKTEDLEVGDLCGFYWNNKLLVTAVILSSRTTCRIITTSW